jgi:hypothetical protein
MVEKNMLGSKTGKGFFFKDRNSPKGEILSLDLKTLEYKPQVKPKFATLDAAKKVDDLRERLKLVYNGTDKAGEFYRRSFHSDVRVREPPHPRDQRRAVQDRRWHARRLRLGGGSVRDLGCHRRESRAGRDEKAGVKVSPWVNEMLAAGHSSFYKVENGKRLFYDVASKSYKPVPRAEGLIVLSDLPESSVVWKNSAATVRHLGDGILSVSWTSKMNTIGAEVIQGLNKAIDLAEQGYKGPGGLQRRRQLQRGRQRGHDLHDGRGAGVRRPGDGRAHLPEHHDAHALQQHPRGGGPAPAVPGRRHRALPARGQGGGARRDLHGPGGIRRGRDPRRRRHQGVRAAPQRRTEGRATSASTRMRERFLTIGQAKVATSGTKPSRSATCARARTR